MRPRVDGVRVLARLSCWFLVLVAGLTCGRVTRGPVIFPSDAALRVELPEWVPRERSGRAAQWTHNKQIQFRGGRRGEDGILILVRGELTTKKPSYYYLKSHI